VPITGARRSGWMGVTAVRFSRSVGH